MDRGDVERSPDGFGFCQSVRGFACKVRHRLHERSRFVSRNSYDAGICRWRNGFTTRRAERAGSRLGGPSRQAAQQFVRSAAGSAQLRTDDGSAGRIVPRQPRKRPSPHGIFNPRLFWQTARIMSRLSNLTLCHEPTSTKHALPVPTKRMLPASTKTRVAYSNETRVILSEAKDLNRSMFATTNASSQF